MSSTRKYAAPPQEIQSESASTSGDDLRIAWRYNDLPVIDAEHRVNNVNYSFDLTKNVSPTLLSSLDITTFDPITLVPDEGVDDEHQGDGFFQNPIYSRLLDMIQSKATPVGDEKKSETLLRISISSLGSPLWFDTDFRRDVLLFLTALKAIVRHSLSVCCISMPVHLFKHYVRINIHMRFT